LYPVQRIPAIDTEDKADVFDSGNNVSTLGRLDFTQGQA